MMTAMLGLTMAMAANQSSDYGTPEILPFYDGAHAAVSLEFDDSMQSQVANALPLLAKYGVRATFFINPGRNDYPGMAPVWEGEVEKAGHELGNHTWTHNGAVDRTHAEEEIHHLSKHLLEMHGGKARVIPFATPGGVPWNVTPAELDAILKEDSMFLATERQFFEDKDAGDPAAPARIALEKGTWARMGFHGVGGQWLSTSVENLSKVLDFLTENKSTIWVAPTGEVYKYVQEKSAALPLSITGATRNGFSLTLKTDPSKNPFGPQKESLFDEPLTLRCRVPDNWKQFTVRTGSEVTSWKTIQEGSNTYAQFHAVPNQGTLQIKVKG